MSLSMTSESPGSYSADPEVKPSNAIPLAELMFMERRTASWFSACKIQTGCRVSSPSHGSTQAGRSSQELDAGKDLNNLI